MALHHSAEEACVLTGEQSSPAPHLRSVSLSLGLLPVPGDHPSPSPDSFSPHRKHLSAEVQCGLLAPAGHLAKGGVQSGHSVAIQSPTLASVFSPSRPSGSHCRREQVACGMQMKPACHL